MSESDSRQLTRDELKTMTAQEIVAAERAGRLEALKRGEPGTPPPAPAPAPAPEIGGPGSDGPVAADGAAVFRPVEVEAAPPPLAPLRLAPGAEVAAAGEQQERGQLTRADLQTMSAAEIVAADREGRLEDLKRSGE